MPHRLDEDREDEVDEEEMDGEPLEILPTTPVITLSPAELRVRNRTRFIGWPLEPERYTFVKSLGAGACRCAPPVA